MATLLLRRGEDFDGEDGMARQVEGGETIGVAFPAGMEGWRRPEGRAGILVAPIGAKPVKLVSTFTT